MSAITNSGLVTPNAGHAASPRAIGVEGSSDLADRRPCFGMGHVVMIWRQSGGAVPFRLVVGRQAAAREGDAVAYPERLPPSSATANSRRRDRGHVVARLPSNSGASAGRAAIKLSIGLSRTILAEPSAAIGSHPDQVDLTSAQSLSRFIKSAMVRSDVRQKGESPSLTGSGAQKSFLAGQLSG